MKNVLNKIQYICVAFGLAATLTTLGIAIYQGRYDAMAVGCLGWIVCAFVYMKECDRNEKRIKELNEEIESIINNFKS